jgi:hypothetical protein
MYGHRRHANFNYQFVTRGLRALVGFRVTDILGGIDGEVGTSEWSPLWARVTVTTLRARPRSDREQRLDALPLGIAQFGLVHELRESSLTASCKLALKRAPSSPDPAPCAGAGSGEEGLP